MTEKIKNELALVMYYADKYKFSVPPITKHFPEYTEKDGYDIQTKLIKRMLDDNLVISGKKIGGISYLNQTNAGGFGPHYGYLWEHKILKSGECLPCNSLLSPGVEAEVAVVISKDLISGEISEDMAKEAVSQLMPAWEIVESRVIRDNKKLQDSLADNASYGGCVLGVPQEVDEIYDKSIAVKIYKNEEPYPCQTGTVSLQQIASSIAWLANCLIQRGDGIHKGDIILTGALTKPLLMLSSGDVFSARFEGLGEALIVGG